MSNTAFPVGATATRGKTMSNSDQTGLTGRTKEQGIHCHDGSAYRDSYCRCSIAQGSIAIEHLQGSTTFAARFALGQGVDRELVAQILEALANAIRNQDVAEDMSPITLDDI